MSEFFPPYIYGGAEVSTDLLVKALSPHYRCQVVTSRFSSRSWRRHGCLIRPLLRRRSLGDKSVRALVRYALDSVIDPIVNSVVLNRSITTSDGDTINFVYSSYTQAPLVVATKLMQRERIVVDVRDLSLVCVNALTYAGYDETKAKHDCMRHLGSMYVYTNGLAKWLLLAGGLYEVLLFKGYTALLKHAINSTDIQLVTLSEYVKRKLVENGFSEEKVRVVPNLMEERKGIGCSNHSTTYDLAYAGRIETPKGIWNLLEAYEQLQDYEIRLAIAGDGTQFQAVAEYIQDKAWHNVALLGRIAPAEVLELYAKSRYIIAPVKAPEGFGRFIQESTATGTPVIAPAVGAIPEGVLDEVTGYLYDPSDANGLTLTIVRALSASGATAARMRYRIRSNADLYGVSRLIAMRRRLYDR